MGGRGILAKTDNSQIKMDEYLRRLEIEEIRKTWDNYRSEPSGSAGGSTGNQVMRKKCACCLQYSLPAFTEYEECPLCGWIDDPKQNLDPTSTVGRNSISLLEAQQRWAKREANG